MIRGAAFLGLVLTSLALSSCSSLPRSGPSHSAIISDAAVRLKAKKDQVDYALVDISKSILPIFAVSTTTSLRDGFDGQRAPAQNTTLGAGDVVEVTIFEAQAGGLFIPLDGSRSGNYITLPAQTVDSGGLISVPYAGDIKVTGRAVSEVQNEIAEKLANRAIEPQVIITTTTSRSNRLSILGDVNSPAEMDVSPRGEKVLDIISRAGGLKAPGVETYVTLERGGKKATALFRTIVSDARENIYVRSGDTIYVNRERRTYLAFGATGLNGRFDFDESDLTLGEAIGKAGGLLDSRADPSQVFLYRVVERSTLERAGVNVSAMAGELIPVIFRADLSDPAVFFAVQAFKMRDKDVLYISNSLSTDVSKVLDLINGVSNASASIPANAVSTRDSVDELIN